MNIAPPGGHFRHYTELMFLFPIEREVIQNRKRKTQEKGNNLEINKRNEEKGRKRKNSTDSFQIKPKTSKKLKNQIRSIFPVAVKLRVKNQVIQLKKITGKSFEQFC